VFRCCFAVEQRLRDLRFDQYDTFKPTAEITGIVHGSAEYWKAVTVRDLADQGCPGHFEYTCTSCGGAGGPNPMGRESESVETGKHQEGRLLYD